ncbi:YcnI family protein [Paenibacillus cremeus]|uniref:YcnI family protein n=2 Tax=Paenibacillus cremeus TaxID=2163881 RepID=A0A559JEB7_9BACL|nr:YcnI family protein [Paenibacillus cremeus]TVX98208.1 YcnI family protein [Paenibacillus cremeus]
MFMLLFAGVASAHVTVQPPQTTQGTYEVFNVRVPTEKDIPTVKVEVKIPAEVTISRFEPKPDWKYDLTKDASGKITSVTWTATGNGLSSTEFGNFLMNGKVADNATQISWKAYQTYKDGSVVEWVGAEGSDKPASVTKVNPKAAGSGPTGHDSATSAPEKTQSPAAAGSSNTALYVAIAALIFGVIAILISISKKKTA